jgi:hypothetical protein
LLLLTPTFLLLLNKPTISEAYKSTGLTVWSNICIQFGAEQGILLNIFFNVHHYKYLGIMLSLNGRFTQALLDLTRRGQKAFFKLKNIFNNIPKFYLNSSVDPLDFQIIELNHRHRGDNLYASVLIIQVNMNDQNQIMLSLNGSFTQALLDLTRRGQKAFFKLKNIFNNIPCSAPNVMHIFDHTVKPVLLYASEIVGLLNNNKNVGVNSNIVYY